MATYKRRGYKPKSKKETEEVVEEQSTTAEVFSTLDESANKTEAFIAKNQNYILGFVGLVALAVLGYLGYQNFIQEPKELEAANEMAQSQDYFGNALEAAATEKDSLFNLALNGGEGKFGFLDITEEYSGTKAANLAHYYAGMSFLNTAKYQEAIDQLDQFQGDDQILGPLAQGAIGDAFMQLDQPEQALEYYIAALEMRSNEFTTPRYLLKAAITALDLKKADQALNYLERLEKEYPNADETRQSAVYLGMAQAMNK
ncbi:hypothetical protein GCM10009117_21610 [Gangjinia marincola]|uniref:Tetratricopeptide repeat protein n=1 Tax=Gangjinia marincola TaxID=578463 RepID=A0ABN1MII6_9FLAO